MSFQLRPKVDNMTSYSDNQTNQWAQYAAAPFDPDQQLGPIHVISSHIGNQRAELPTHTHRNGQFVFVHKGFVTCFGYESPSPFIALFKAIVGMTPGQFSQQHLYRPIN